MPNNTEIKAIETYYNGYKFRSRLEARWAVFFDACGIKYEYEPEGYEMDGVRYLPDFRLSNISNIDDDLFIEVKGVLKDNDCIKLVSFIEKDNNLLLLRNIPSGKSREHFIKDIEDSFDEDNEIKYFSVFMLGYCGEMAFIAINHNGKPIIVKEKFEEDFDTDWEKTLSAYKKARSARFEYDDAEPREPIKKPNEEKKHQRSAEENGKINLRKCAVEALIKGRIEAEGTKKRGRDIFSDLYLYARSIQADSEKEVVKALVFFLDMQFDTFAFEVDADNLIPGTNIKYLFNLKRFSKIYRSTITVKAIKHLINKENSEVLEKAEKLFDNIEDDERRAFEFALYANKNFEEPLRTCVTRECIRDLEKIFNEYGE